MLSRTRRLRSSRRGTSCQLTHQNEASGMVDKPSAHCSRLIVNQSPQVRRHRRISSALFILSHLSLSTFLPRDSAESIRARFEYSYSIALQGDSIFTNRLQQADKSASRRGRSNGTSSATIVSALNADANFGVWQQFAKAQPIYGPSVMIDISC